MSKSYKFSTFYKYIYDIDYHFYKDTYRNKDILIIE